MEMNTEDKVKRLGAVIAQLQHDNANLKDLVHPDTPSEKFIERKSAIQDLVTQLEEMEQERLT